MEIFIKNDFQFFTIIILSGSLPQLRQRAGIKRNVANVITMVESSQGVILQLQNWADRLELLMLTYRGCYDMLRSAWNLDRLQGSGVATSGEQGNQVSCFKKKPGNLFTCFVAVSF